ncbi:MAG TPA: RNA polymerase sigma factor [Burkholderiales bacterium]|jgi:RNA polymerase sigma-70 factor (ECF subfamily)
MPADTQAHRKDDLSSDLDLVSRIRLGDMPAMETLMRRHNRALFRTARAILLDDAEAEDAVQEAYLHAYHALGSFRGEAKLSTWLVRIAANEALMRRRRRVRQGEVIPLGDGAIDMKPGPENEAMRGEVGRLLEAKIDALPESYRVVFMLRAIEEMSVEETASALDMPPATVRTRFFRARGLLRESLARDVDAAMQDAFSFAGQRCDRLVQSVFNLLKTRQG